MAKSLYMCRAIIVKALYFFRPRRIERVSRREEKARRYTAVSTIGVQDKSYVLDQAGVIMQWEILCAEILFIELLPLCPSLCVVP